MSHRRPRARHRIDPSIRARTGTSTRECASASNRRTTDGRRAGGLYPQRAPCSGFRQRARQMVQDAPPSPCLAEITIADAVDSCTHVIRRSTPPPSDASAKREDMPLRMHTRPAVASLAIPRPARRVGRDTPRAPTRPSGCRRRPAAWESASRLETVNPVDQLLTRPRANAGMINLRRDSTVSRMMPPRRAPCRRPHGGDRRR